MSNIDTYFKNLEDKINKKISESLENEVAETVTNVMQQNILETVYQSYTPTIYKRRGESGGLIASENIISDVNDLELTVQNIADASPSLLGSEALSPFPTWIEEGKVPNIFNDGDYIWMEPRPFTQNTINDLKTNKQHVKALKVGLRKRGLNAR